MEGAHSAGTFWRRFERICVVVGADAGVAVCGGVACRRGVLGQQSFTSADGRLAFQPDHLDYGAGCEAGDDNRIRQSGRRWVAISRQDSWRGSRSAGVIEVCGADNHAALGVATTIQNWIRLWPANTTVSTRG